jgi:glycosyltransferase involved in cell wall biosynthesis
MPQRLLFDLSGLLAWYAYFPNPSGIQRVTEHLLSSKAIQQSTRTEFVARAIGSDVLYVIDREALHDLCDIKRRPLGIARLRAIFAQSMRLASPARLRREFRYFHVPYAIAGALGLEALIEGLFSRQVPTRRTALRTLPAPTASDTFFNPGDFWCHDGYVESIVEMKRSTGMRVVQLVHDLFANERPDWTHPGFGHVITGQFERLAPHVDTWLATSNFVRATLSDYLGTHGQHERPIDVLPMGWRALGNSARNADPGGDRRIIGKYGLTGRKYILHVGTVEPRKNLMSLIDAMSDLHRQNPKPVPCCVLVGREGWRSEGIRRRLESTRFEDGRILWLKNVSDGELAALYRGAQFAVVPSTIEGWGLPIRESLAHGLPCIASRAGGMEESGQDLATYFDPADAEGLKAAMARWINDEAELQRVRARLEIHFKSEAGSLGWEAAGEAVLRAAFE